MNYKGVLTALAEFESLLEQAFAVGLQGDEKTLVRRRLVELLDKISRGTDADEAVSTITRTLFDQVRTLFVFGFSTPGAIAYRIPLANKIAELRHRVLSFH